MKPVIFLLIFGTSLLNCVHIINSEVFSSTAGMTKLLKSEKLVLEALQKFYNEFKNKSNELTVRLNRYLKIHDTAMKDVSKFLDLPTNAFMLTKRFLFDYPEFLSIVTTQTFNKDVVFFPDYKDFNGTVSAILRLQDTYDLDTHDLADGVINGIDYGNKMTASDCFAIANQSNVNKNYFYAELWVKEALRRVKLEHYPTFSEVDGLTLLANLAGTAGRFHFGLEVATKMVELKMKDPKNNLPQLADWQKDLLKQQQEKNFNIDEHKLFEKPTRTKDQTIYDKACRGEILKTPAEQTELKCRYKKSHTPYAPFKLEESNLDPQIVVFHDVMLNKEIEELKKLALSRLYRATIADKAGNLVKDNRVSQVAWLSPKNHTVVAKIHQRIGDMTDLNMEPSEMLQLGNYGIGGHYVLHRDYFSDATISNSPFGNRISTVLFYMSDVEQGGATIFPHHKVIVYPKRGTAAFWYNLHRDSNVDFTTIHAACPVIVGSKWVANSWNREQGQEFRRPCGLMKDSRNDKENKEIAKIYY